MKTRRAAGAPGSVRSRRTIRDAKCANDGEGRGEEQIPSDKGRDSQTCLSPALGIIRGRDVTGRPEKEGAIPTGSGQVVSGP